MVEESQSAKRTEPFRLGGLAYEPLDRRFSRAHAQDSFLTAAAEEQPALLDELAGAPLSVYRDTVWFRIEAASDLPPWEAVDFVNHWATWQAFLRELQFFAQQCHPHIDLEPLKLSVEGWASRWNLGGIDWVKATALRTLGVWAVLPNAPLTWCGQETLVEELIPPTARQFQVVAEGWDPRFETREDCVRRLRQEFARHLDDHFEVMAQQIEAAGLLPTPTKRGGEEHWSWLAQRVILDWPYERIAEEAGLRRVDAIATESVYQAVRKAAELADLPLPPGKPGRRPKAKR